MKRICLRILITVFAFALSIMTNAEEITIDGINYNVITKGCVAEVIAGSTKYTGNISIPDKITYNGVIYDVTSIGYGAFRECTGVTGINLPVGITSIGNSAFEGCRDVVMVELPEGLETIGEWAFHNCTALSFIKFPESIAVIGSGAFYGCSVLNNFKLPGSITTIGSSAFYGCTSITNITIPDGIKEICSNTFAGCTNLITVEIPNSVTSIDSYAFSHNPALTEIEIPNSVTKIGDYAFAKCTGLERIEIPVSVTKIGNGIFSACTALASVAMSNNITSIPKESFRDCTALENITMPNITGIGESAFIRCTSLQSIELPNSLEYINKQAFYGCTELKIVTIGNGTKYIYSAAFANCEKLSDVYCLATAAPSAYDNTFSGSYPEYITLHIPYESVSAYRETTPWNNFGSIVSLDGEECNEPQCATPILTYNDGALNIVCDTEGAEFVTTITDNDIKKHYTNRIELTATYEISVYATKVGYRNSETINAVLCWIDAAPSMENIATTIEHIQSTPLLIQYSNGLFRVSGATDGSEVSIYTVGGNIAGKARITNGIAEIATSVNKGEFVIISSNEHRFKIVAQ